MFILTNYVGFLMRTACSLLAMIDSPHYLISTDGTAHAHPDVEVLKAIVDRPSTFERKLYFTSSTEASRFLRSYRSKSGAAFQVVEVDDSPTVIELG